VLLTVPAAASAAGTTATTAPADPSLITDTYALLSGVLNPGGVATVYWFQWGKTTAYGQATPVTPAGNGAADVPVDVSLDTLKPGTTYHYRLWAKPVGDPTAGDVVGADQSFTTAPALAVGIVGRAVHVSATGKALVKLKAVGPPDESAAGVLKLTAKVNGQTLSFGFATL
jgi:phosphodiesterase/alkaline phosphatase D-like protein